jgi:hypothetical protein
MPNMVAPRFSAVLADAVRAVSSAALVVGLVVSCKNDAPAPPPASAPSGGGGGGGGGATVGRRQELDGPLTVSSKQDWQNVGSVAVMALRAAKGSTDAGASSEIDFAIQSSSDRPLRFIYLEAVAVDDNGKAKRPKSPPAELIVPPKGKATLTVAFDAPAASLVKARLGGANYDLAYVRRE